MTNYNKLIATIEKKTIDKSFTWIPLSSSESNIFFNPHSSDEKYKNYETDPLESYACEYNGGYFLLITFIIKQTFPASAVSRLLNPPKLLLSYIETSNKDYEIIRSDDESLLKLRKLIELNNNFKSSVMKKLDDLSES